MLGLGSIFSGGILSSVASVGKQWLSNKAEKTKAKHTLQIAEINNRARLMESTRECNHDWEMTALRASSRYLKWASFSLFALPIIFTVAAPFLGGNAAVGEMWANFERVPDGWMRIYYAITGGIWGIASLKDMGATPGALLSGLTQLRKNRVEESKVEAGAKS